MTIMNSNNRRSDKEKIRRILYKVLKRLQASLNNNTVPLVDAAPTVIKGHNTNTNNYHPTYTTNGSSLLAQHKLVVVGPTSSDDKEEFIGDIADLDNSSSSFVSEGLRDANTCALGGEASHVGLGGKYGGGGLGGNMAKKSGGHGGNGGLGSRGGLGGGGRLSQNPTGGFGGVCGRLREDLANGGGLRGGRSLVSGLAIPQGREAEYKGTIAHLEDSTKQQKEAYISKETVNDFVSQVSRLTADKDELATKLEGAISEVSKLRKHEAKDKITIDNLNIRIRQMETAVANATSLENSLQCRIGSFSNELNAILSRTTKKMKAYTTQKFQTFQQKHYPTTDTTSEDDGES